MSDINISINRQQKPKKVAQRLNFGSDDEDSTNDKVAVTEIDEHGRTDGYDTTQKEELVIELKSNESWRENVRKRVYGFKKTDPPKDEPEIQYGLNKIEKQETPSESREGSNDSSNENREKKELSAEEAARKALISGENYDDLEEIPVLDEEEAFQRDIDDRPDAPGLEVYQRVPVEGFGAAILRGMEKRANKAAPQPAAAEYKTAVNRRQALLGLGAKPLERPSEELGAWGKGASKKVTRVEKTYIPVVQVDSEGNPIEDQRDDEENASRKEYERESSRKDYERDSRLNYDSRKDYERDSRKSYDSSRRRERSKDRSSDRERSRRDEKYRESSSRDYRRRADKDSKRSDGSRYDDSRKRYDRDRRRDYRRDEKESRDDSGDGRYRDSRYNRDDKRYRSRRSPSPSRSSRSSHSSRR